MSLLMLCDENSESQRKEKINKMNVTSLLTKFFPATRLDEDEFCSVFKILAVVFHKQRHDSVHRNGFVVRKEQTFKKMHKYNIYCK